MCIQNVRPLPIFIGQHMTLSECSLPLIDPIVPERVFIFFLCREVRIVPSDFVELSLTNINQ